MHINKTYYIQRYHIYDTLYIVKVCVYIYKNTLKYVFISIFKTILYLYTHVPTNIARVMLVASGAGKPHPAARWVRGKFPVGLSHCSHGAGQEKPLGSDPFLEGLQHLLHRGVVLSLVLFCPFSGVDELRAGGFRVVLFCFIFL